MVDCRTEAHQFGFLVLLAVIDHQREVDIAVGQMARDMSARAPGMHLPEAEYILVELCSRFEVGHFERYMVDPRHHFPPIRRRRYRGRWPSRCGIPLAPR